ncbi:MAG: hypothetical protein HYW70_00735 [Candidatus Nealsonbacteria bacterium]|nr:hypothetical protein [Candidatus Nealsonbacteria bacterium]
MSYHPLLFTLAAIGISESVYLIRTRMAGQRPVCVIGKDCHKVLESEYRKIFGIDNDTLALIFYIIVSLTTAILVLEAGPVVFIQRLAKILILTGAGFSVLTIFVQWRLIKAWCFWCLMASATVFLMAITILMMS